MGVTKKPSSGSETIAPNPDPSNFKIESIFYDSGYTVALVSYPGCTTFEGKKILVFTGDRIKDLTNATSIDPHFELTSALVARFIATEQGMRMARRFIRSKG
jgi:hypothetical protein